MLAVAGGDGHDAAQRKTRLAAVNQLPAGGLTRRAGVREDELESAVFGRRRRRFGHPDRHGLNIFLEQERARDCARMAESIGQRPQEMPRSRLGFRHRSPLGQRPALTALGQFDEGLPSSLDGDDETRPRSRARPRTAKPLPAPGLGRPAAGIWQCCQSPVRSGTAIAPGLCGLSFRHSPVTPPE